MPEDIENPQQTAQSRKLMEEYNAAIGARNAAKAEPEAQPNGNVVQAEQPDLDAPALMRPRTVKAALDLARSLADTELVPQSLQGKPEAVLLIVMDAMDRGANVLSHLRTRSVVKGNLSVAAAAIILEVNRSGLFKGILRFAFEGLGTPELACTAYAIEKESDERVEHRFTLAQAELAGWTRKSNNWLAIPEQMCAYRAATFFARLYCPEAVIGLNLADEAEHMNPGADADRRRARELTDEVTLVPDPLNLTKIPVAAATKTYVAADGGRAIAESSDPNIAFD